MKFNTALLHQNFNGEEFTGSTVMPIYQVSAFAHESAEKLEKVFNNKAPGFAYTRISNPTVDSFEKRVAAMENGIGAVACSSGMAAVTMSIHKYADFLLLLCYDFLGLEKSHEKSEQKVVMVSE